MPSSTLATTRPPVSLGRRLREHLAVRQVVRGKTKLPEHDGQRGGDEELRPVVAEHQERGDAADEGEADGRETHRVIQRTATQQTRIGYSPGQLGEIAPSSRA